MSLVRSRCMLFEGIEPEGGCLEHPEALLAAGGAAEDVDECGEADGRVFALAGAARFVGANFEAEAEGTRAVEGGGGKGEALDAPLFGGVGEEIGGGGAGLASVLGGELHDGETFFPKVVGEDEALGGAGLDETGVVQGDELKVEGDGGAVFQAFERPATQQTQIRRRNLQGIAGQAWTQLITPQTDAERQRGANRQDEQAFRQKVYPSRTIGVMCPSRKGKATMQVRPSLM